MSRAPGASPRAGARGRWARVFLANHSSWSSIQLPNPAPARESATLASVGPVPGPSGVRRGSSERCADCWTVGVSHFLGLGHHLDDVHDFSGGHVRPECRGCFRRWNARDVVQDRRVFGSSGGSPGSGVPHHSSCGAAGREGRSLGCTGLLSPRRGDRHLSQRAARWLVRGSPVGGAWESRQIPGEGAEMRPFPGSLFCWCSLGV